jgi:hypothetical protein
MSEQKYQAGGAEYFYPAAGDPAPTGGAKVLLLTIGGICVLGAWSSTAKDLLGWAPLPKRNREKEQCVRDR